MAKGAYIGASGVARKIKKGYIGVSDVARKIKKAYIGVGGVARLFYQSGLPLSDLPEGALVSINENGSPVNFYLAKHDYESGLNGAGRILFVRQYCYDTGPYGRHSTYKYSNSDIDVWLNSTYLQLFDTEMQNQIGLTTFKSNEGGAQNLSRAVFVLSLQELGFDGTYAYKLGSKLPTANILKSAKNSSGSNVAQWTRNLYSDLNDEAYYILSGGSKAGHDYDGRAYYRRPVFTLPSDMAVNPEPNADGSYTLIV